MATEAHACSCRVTPTQSCLQVTPVFQEILELDDTTMEWLRVGFSTATSVCGLVSARPLLQAHLHSAMVQWWTHRSAGRNLQVLTLVHGWRCMECSLKGHACMTQSLWTPLPSTPGVALQQSHYGLNPIPEGRGVCCDAGKHYTDDDQHHQCPCQVHRGHCLQGELPLLCAL